MNYQLTQRAKEDVIDIFLQGAGDFGEKVAERYHIKLEQTFELLSRYPELAQERAEIAPAVRVHPFQAHIIIYRIQDDRSILIIRVRHSREDWIEHPAGAEH